jgi:hypothetical protein
MKDNYYSLLHALKMRRAILASRLQEDDPIEPSDLLGVDDVYKNTPYSVVYCKLREVVDRIHFTSREHVVELVESYHTDRFFRYSKLPRYQDHIFLRLMMTKRSLNRWLIRMELE